MKDLEFILNNVPGTLALMGETLGHQGISLEGGGVFYNGQQAIAHFLVAEPERAKQALEEAGIEVTKINEVLVQRLRQDVPGQLGTFCRRMAVAGVNILTQYSDHAGQLIVIVDNQDRGRKVSEEWRKEWWNSSIK